MGKNGLDERQEQITAKAGALGFYVMFLTAVFVILVQLLWNGSIENVIGETLILIAGGVTCLVGYVKNGIWTNNQSSMSVWQNLLGSVVCSGIFSVLYGIVIRKKAGPDVEIAGYVALFSWESQLYVSSAWRFWEERPAKRERNRKPSI
ncbi:DUF6773 family protein [Blautia hydrogenotrophica]|uniref:DUF6773 family protein n=1 Tax=Blautia hydrogenotrophica TaxID=53443 RepID=UPI003AB26442